MSKLSYEDKINISEKEKSSSEATRKNNILMNALTYKKLKDAIDGNIVNDAILI